MKKLFIILPLFVLILLAFKPIEGLLWANFTEEESGIPTDSLVAYYPFNGNAQDVVGTNHCAIEGATLTSDKYGNTNSAYYFDGDDFMFNLVATLQETWSLSIWFNIYNTTGRKTLFSQYTTPDNPPTINRTFFSINNGKIEYFVAGSNLGTTSINTYQWYHVIFDSSGKAYLNANATPEIAITPGYPIQIFNVIGARHNLYGSIQPPTDHFIGKIDNIRIYNKILTTDEITALYNE